MENSLNSLQDDYVDLSPKEWHLLDKFLPPKEVCHYTRMSTALEDILYKGELLLGNLNKTNDPKESKTRIGEFINEPRNRCDVAGIIRSLGYIADIKVLCTCCHNQPSWEITDQQNGEAYKYGVSRSPMWAHYADRYKGVCIVFDGKALHENIHNKIIENGGDPKKDIRCGYVMYDYDASIALTQGDISFDTTEGNIDKARLLMKNYDVNFLRKSPEWKSEHEFRWLVVSDQKSKLLVSIKNAIRAVVVSEDDFNKAYYPLLEAKRKELNFRLGHISWSDGRPEVVFPLKC